MRVGKGCEMRHNWKGSSKGLKKLRAIKDSEKRAFNNYQKGLLWYELICLLKLRQNRKEEKRTRTTSQSKGYFDGHPGLFSTVTGPAHMHAYLKFAC